MKNYFIIVIVCTLGLMAGCVQNPQTTDNDFKPEKPGKSIYVLNIFDEASMKVVKSSVTPASLTVEFTYSGDNECVYGSWFTLEVFKNDQWGELPYAFSEDIEIGWTAEAYPIAKGKVRLEDIDWEFYYGKLSDGQYRIIKDVLDVRENDGYTKYYLASEFVIN